MLKTKSVTSPIDAKRDGLRILATRFRGRRVAATQYDVWMPSLGPSERLLETFRAGTISWREFARRYKDEVFARTVTDAANRSIKNHGQKFTLRLIKHLSGSGHVTLMGHCAEDERHCHRHLLYEIVRRS